MRAGFWGEGEAAGWDAFEAQRLIEVRAPLLPLDVIFTSAERGARVAWILTDPASFTGQP